MDSPLHRGEEEKAGGGEEFKRVESKKKQFIQLKELK